MFGKIAQPMVKQALLVSVTLASNGTSGTRGGRKSWSFELELEGESWSFELELEGESWRRSADADAAAIEPIRTRGDDPQRLGVCDVLLHLDARVQGLGRVILQNRHRALHQYRPGVGSGVHEMDRDPRHLAAVV